MPSLGEIRVEREVLGRDAASQIFEKWYKEVNSDSTPMDILNSFIAVAGLVNIGAGVVGMLMTIGSAFTKTDAQKLLDAYAEAFFYLNDFPDGTAYAVVEHTFKYSMIRDSFYDAPRKYWDLQDAECTEKRAYNV